MISIIVLLGFKLETWLIDCLMDLINEMKMSKI